jgi:hypothetical protein
VLAICVNDVAPHRFVVQTLFIELTLVRFVCTDSFILPTNPNPLLPSNSSSSIFSTHTHTHTHNQHHLSHDHHHYSELCSSLLNFARSFCPIRVSFTRPSQAVIVWSLLYHCSFAHFDRLHDRFVLDKLSIVGHLLTLSFLAFSLPSLCPLFALSLPSKAIPSLFHLQSCSSPQLVRPGQSRIHRSEFVFAHFKCDSCSSKVFKVRTLRNRTTTRSLLIIQTPYVFICTKKDRIGHTCQVKSLAVASVTTLEKHHF